MEIVALADAPDTTVVLDAFHIYRGGGSDEDILKLRGEQVSIFHIDDVPEDGRTRQELADGDRVYPGDGILNLVGMLKMLTTIGFSGPVSLELFREDLWTEDPFTVACSGAEKVRRLFEGIA
jgi:sugar phosphate isomerase/epimerase